MWALFILLALSNVLLFVVIFIFFNNHEWWDSHTKWAATDEFKERSIAVIFCNNLQCLLCSDRTFVCCLLFPCQGIKNFPFSSSLLFNQAIKKFKNWTVLFKQILQSVVVAFKCVIQTPWRCNWWKIFGVTENVPSHQIDF